METRNGLYENCMHEFRHLAERLLARDAAVMTFVGFGVMIAFSFEPPVAFVAAGAVALTFCLALILRAWPLTEERVPDLEAWRHTTPDERPIGDAGLSWARDQIQEVFLYAAKTAASVAVSFGGAALALELVT
jgi:hypothetical protein